MKIIQILSLTFATLFASNLALAQNYAQCEGPLITMSAIGEVESIPDIAEVSLNVKSQADDEAAALRGLSENIERILNVLDGLGIADQDMRTDSITIRPVYNQRNRQEIIAYAGTSRVYFKTYQLSKITELMSGVMAGSDNLFSNITYSSSDQEELEDQAREKAFKKAFHKAELYADLSGNDLEEICTITEGNVRVVPSPYRLERVEQMAMAPAAADISIPIRPGKIKTTAQVTLVYQLED